MDRRKFLQTSAALAVTGVNVGASRAAAPEPRQVRLGVIGAGSRGKEALRQFLRVPGVSVAAVCDIYPPRYVEMERLLGHSVPHTADHHELLTRTDIDAYYIASPLKCHAEHVIAAARTGRPIYAEKALGFTVEDCFHIVDEVQKSKSIFQIGHQYRYASWIQESMKRIAGGDIGEPTHIYAYWHRNNDWRRPVPSPDPDGKLEHLINWRLYRETSGGLVTELGSHQIDLANWVFGEQPQSVMGSTSICRYHDGRTVGDNVQAIFEYSNGRRLVFSSITDNTIVGNQFWVYGTKGSVQITIEDATFYYEKVAGAKPVSDKTVVQRGLETGASYVTAAAMPYRGPGDRLAIAEYEDPTLSSARSFIEAVRGEHGTIAGVHEGFRSAIASSVAHDAVFSGQKQTIPTLSS